MFAIFQWLQGTEIATALRESAYMYPIVMALHLTGMAIFGGLILMTDLRLLGIVLRGATISEVVGQFRIWKRVGLALVAGCGILLAWAKAEQYYGNPYFWLKMTFLLLVGVHALVFRRSVYRNTAKLDNLKVMPSQVKWAAGFSLCLWIGLVSAGRLIGYYEPKP